MKNRQHIRLLGIVVVLVISVAVGFNLFQKFQNSSPPSVAGTSTLAKEDPSAWKTFSSNELKLMIKHPSNVILDSRKNAGDKSLVFIFDKDKTKPLEKVPGLYITITNKKQLDGASSGFKRGTVSPTKNQTININNTVAIRNPLPGDIDNYYITNNLQNRPVINVYVSGNTDKKNKDIQEKLKIFNQMIKTINLTR